MKSRRYFLIQGTLATTAMFALKPLAIIARTTSPFTGFSETNTKLVFIHTANVDSSGDDKVIQYISDIKMNSSNAILLTAVRNFQNETGSLSYDDFINIDNSISPKSEQYKIINKGNLKTGIIYASPGQSDVIQKIKALAAYLKNEKHCNLVVCLSQLGYKNYADPDDISLAKSSTHLDIIIGGHPENFHKYPVVALNDNNGEVIIHSAADDSITFGKIDIDFDGQGRKKNISFTNQ